MLDCLWAGQQIPLPYGLYRASGTFRPIRRTNQDFILGETESMPPEGGKTCYVDVTCEVQHEDCRICAGTTTWESDGFVLVTGNSGIRWLAHLPGIEEPREIHLNGKIVEVWTREYPWHNRITLALVDPDTIHIQAQKRKTAEPGDRGERGHP